MPSTELVFLQPDPTPWWQKALAGPTAFYRKWLSEGVVALDGTPFSHVMTRQDGSYIDATLAGVACRIYPATSPRPRTRMGPAVGSLDPAWEHLVDTYGPCPEILSDDADPSDFTVLGMMRLGLHLFLEGSPRLSWLGRWLIERHVDVDGYFCSELVAKACAETGVTIKLQIPRRRLKRLVAAPQTALSLHERSGGSAITAAEWLDSIDELLDQPGIASFEMTVGVGLAEYPPSLVSPGDLFHSPSLEHRAPGNVPSLTPEEWRRRRREWFLWTLAPPAALVVIVRRVLGFGRREG